MPKGLLVFPPGWSPVGPYLALPVLKSYLKEKINYNIGITDLNVEFYDELLSSEYVNECCARFRAIDGEFSEEVRLTFDLIEQSALDVDEAKAIFRLDRYFDLDERQYAENVFRNALYIINHASNGARYTFNSIDLPYSY